MPSRDSRPDAANPIIAPIADTAKAPLATPITTTDARSGQAGPTRAAHAIPPIASAEATQPPTVHARIARCRNSPANQQHTATPAIPASTPACCNPVSPAVCPGVAPNTAPANGSSTTSCAL